MTPRPVDSRIDTLCDTCQRVDKHPRHHQYDPAMQQNASRHFDCCAAMGCPVCAQALTEAPEGAQHGDALTAHLTKGM